jgi:hypothetical protein
VCNGTNIGVSISVELTSLAMHVESLIDGRGQQTTNWQFVWHCKQGETQWSVVYTSQGAMCKAY